MRRLACSIFLVLLIPCSAPAAVDQYEYRAYPVRVINKFFRGISNVLGSPIEVGANVYKEGRSAEVSGENVLAVGVASATGVVTGIGYMFARIGVGVFDVVTFPWPTSPVMQPSTPATIIEWMDMEPRSTLGLESEKSRRPQRVFEAR